MVDSRSKTVLYGQDKITVLKYDNAGERHQVLVIEKVDGTVSYRYELGHVEIMYQCRLCREYGKSLFSAPLFSSQEDLNLHVQRLHGGYPDSGRQSTGAALVRGAVEVLNGTSGRREHD